MEQPCYKCGQAVEEGIPFCPHCSAPQIRVMIPEPVTAPSVLNPAAATSQGSVGFPAAQSAPTLAFSIRWSQALKSCALAALVASLLMSLGLNPFVAMFSVGVLAVILHRQRRKEFPITASTGAGLGALAGLLWFAMSAILEALTVFLLHQGPALHEEVLKKIQEAASKTTDPQVLAMFDRVKTPEGFEFLLIAALVFAFFAAIALGSLGGLLGGAILGGRDRH